MTILQEKQKIVDAKANYPDSLKAIQRFMKNIKLGRSHYVSFAITTGFRSINYTEPEFGNTALHYAAARGYPLVVEELMKYKADPNIKNRFSNCPIHEAWNFWRMPNIAAERERQAAVTCDIIHALVSYGADVDVQKGDGDTALHVAARFGHINAVKKLLEFQANHLITNKKRQTPQEVATASNHHEIAQLLSFWSLIRQHYVHVDFNVQWREFLSNYEATISSGRSVEATMFELNMKENLRGHRLDSIYDFPLDDPLLRDAAVASQELERQRREALEEEIRQYEARQKQEQFVTNINAALGKGKAGVKMRLDPNTEYYHHLIERNREKAVDKDGVNKMLSNILDISHNIAHANSEKIIRIPTEELSESTPPKPPHQLHQRRLRAAQKYSLDAKFEKFTVTPCTSSALMISRRRDDAPLRDTPEEFSMTRYLTTKKEVREVIAHDRKKKRDYMKKVVAPKKNKIGAYATASELVVDPTERQKLYKRLYNEAAAEKERLADQMLQKTFSVQNADRDTLRNSKIDMVHNRARFVASNLLPPRESSSVYQDLKIKLREEENLEMRSTTDVSSEASMSVTSTINVLPPVVKVEYGKGRLQSTHMCKGKLENPWDCVPGDYKMAGSQV